MTARSIRCGFGFGPNSVHASHVLVSVRMLDAKLAYNGSGPHNYNLSVTKMTVGVVTKPATLTYSGTGPPATPVGLVIVLQGKDIASYSASAPAPQNPSRTDLAWTASATATGYDVLRRKNGAAATLVSSNQAGTTFSDTTATNCVNGTAGSGPQFYPADTYVYQVAARNASGVSALSDSQSFIEYQNGVHNFSGDYSSDCTVDYNDTTGAPPTGTKCILCTLTNTFGLYLPHSGNLTTEWNFWCGAFGYLEWDMKVGTAGMDFHIYALRSGDVNIYNASAVSYNNPITNYGPALTTAWQHYKAPLSSFLSDYGPSGAGPQANQYAFYKIAFQEDTGKPAGSKFWINNIKWTPPDRLSFGDSFTVTGTGFGSKSTTSAGPQVWDYGQAGAGVLDSQWDGGHPLSTATGKLQNYAAGTNSVALPHAHCQAMLAGLHQHAEVSSCVGPWLDFDVTGALTFPFYVYIDELWMIDPSWQFNLDPLDQNFKHDSYSHSGGGAAPGDGWYTEYVNDEFTSSSATPQMHCNDDPRTIFDQPTGTWYGSDSSNPVGTWRKRRALYKITNASNGGFLRSWDAGTQILNVSNRTDTLSGTDRSMQLGAYARQYTDPISTHTHQWRYHADMLMFVDKNPGRFVLTDNATYASSTKFFTQAWSSWSSTSVALKLNQGNLGSGTWFLHYLDEVNGNQLNLRTVTCNA